MLCHRIQHPVGLDSFLVADEDAWIQPIFKIATMSEVLMYARHPKVCRNWTASLLPYHASSGILSERARVDKWLRRNTVVLTAST
jgi:hypothetical protein